RKLGTGFKLLFERNHQRGEGQISPFNALMTALSATIGTGNIAGVATAVVLGGPGALFWMWITALVGMATKYSEAVLAVRFREVDKNGHYVGGPMYYIKN
ncbi:alanine:cation symporter family protein, partial [Enterobacter hormaechei]|nr:alanine:cation symporter family protein [Enterobacter hormaechei]